MAYDQQTWANDPIGGTPVSAFRLNHMEAGIDQAHVIAEAVVPSTGMGAVSSVATLKAITGPSNGDTRMLISYDGTSNTYAPCVVMRDTSLASFDEAFTFDHNTESGGWKRVFSGPLNLLWANANPTGGNNKAAWDKVLSQAATTDGEIYVPPGRFGFSQAPNTADDVRVRGEGRGSKLVCNEDFPSGEALFDLTNRGQMKFEDLYVQNNQPNTTTFLLDGAFGNTFVGLWVSGQHSPTSFAPNQRAFHMKNVAGGNRFYDCLVQNHGVGYYVESNLNEVIGGGVLNCRYAYHSPVSTGGSMALIDAGCGGVYDGTVLAHLQIDGNGFNWYISDCWWEGALNNIVCGASDGSAGTDQLVLHGGYMQSLNTNIVLRHSKYTLLSGVLFVDSVGGTPTTPISINATNCPYGTADNLQIHTGEISPSVFPQAWSVRSKTYHKTFGKRQEFATAAPTTGTWARGDIVWNSQPSAGGTIGWVCTTAGTPGTWRTWGTIA